MRYRPPDESQRNAFHQGQSRRAYQMLGAHPVQQDGQSMWHFAVWAPNALAVSLTGEFCAWDIYAHPMQKQYDGIWELRLPALWFSPQCDPVKYGYPQAAERLRAYKFAVQTQPGEWHLRSDPYAFASELRPNTASLLTDLDVFEWHDRKWLKARAKWDARRSPLNIYEVHLPSWRTADDGRVLSYGEIADQLIPYVLDMGYTHVELLPVMEHPLDMSWGYQVTGHFAPTARCGSPWEFMSFVDRMHQAGIGVLLDWVPAHFPKDEIGLRQFDGTPCYEHADPRRAEMPQWGTLMFDLARGEVSSFLLSAACFWLEYYHADGLRCDAVTSMLYHDFGREDWLPNAFGSHENLDAVAFLRRLNQTIAQHFPGVITVAEESTAFPAVTHPVDAGGLGFSFKWNMGWMNDMLAYVNYDFGQRPAHHDKLTFSLMYAFGEHYILPFSHDEVVHLKKSMLDKQPGDLWQKFAGLRALYGYMIAHPGKKLLFMGGEFGQFIEWRCDRQLDWMLLLYEKHPGVKLCVQQLNRLYRQYACLHQLDDSWEGFEWLAVDDSQNALVAFLRRDSRGGALVCLTNFTPAFFPTYRLGLPQPGTLREIFNSDLIQYGGSNQYNAAMVTAQPQPSGSLPYSADVCVPPLATVYFHYEVSPQPK